MKIFGTKTPMLALPLAASLLLCSCSSTGQRGNFHRGVGGAMNAEKIARPQATPSDSYYHRGRYYSGGRYETGRHVFEGQVYDNRYLHNGQYLYGGSLREYPSDGSGQIRSRRSTGAGYVSATTPPMKHDQPYYSDR